MPSEEQDALATKEAGRLPQILPSLTQHTLRKHLMMKDIKMKANLNKRFHKTLEGFLKFKNLMTYLDLFLEAKKQILK